ncbi:hypothetical protein ABFS83_04G216200 [Erythranthe nasuta]
MGYLLKEALKTLCGVNQWCYAVFWKIGCQNPKLLIWEECYYEPATCSGLPGISGSENLEGSFRDYGASWAGGDKVHLLVNKMMMDNQVNIVGEGLVGRVAFTGNHQWIVSDNCFGEAHPPEVLKEVCQQFSAGMQTVAVIPVLPHGVVQFGSFLTIRENMGFINDVISLLLQLGYLDDFNYVQNELHSNGAPFQSSNSNPSRIVPQYYHQESKVSPLVNSNFPSSNQLATKAEVVIPSNSAIWTDQNASLYTQGPTLDFPSGSSSKNRNSIPKMDAYNSDSLAHFTADFSQSGTKYDNDLYVQTESGDDLFDVLGADFKSKLFSSSSSFNSLINLPSKTSSEIYSTSQENSENGIIFTTDHLLEAVVSKVNAPSAKQGIDEDISCRTTLTNTSTSSAPDTSIPYARLGELFGVPKYSAKNGKMMSSCSKEESGSYSQGSSIYGSSSQISSSWVPQADDRKGKQNNGIATNGYSKKPEETSKTNRKRLKPGENPRPRPKDRQMIQDRVKELREIVPNGAKCSIDALLERTIKHMIFLQSVTKHADKLKQTGESKFQIISKDGGLLLKDNFEGGATWAYEVGSQSMVCPIIVEDLNQPRQMLVEMLCEERGLFLEIADIIRGLGLTILKGVMETRNDKIWARFAVEANRDVTRMEIFISLVRLLEQSAKSGESLMAQQFHQLASVPVSNNRPR